MKTNLKTFPIEYYEHEDDACIMWLKDFEAELRERKRSLPATAVDEIFLIKEILGED